MPQIFPNFLLFGVRIYVDVCTVIPVLLVAWVCGAAAAVSVLHQYIRSTYVSAHKFKVSTIGSVELRALTSIYSVFVRITFEWITFGFY